MSVHGSVWMIQELITRWYVEKMIWNISTGETRIKIFELCGVLFAVLVVYSIIWVCGVMKASPFQPVPVEVINDASVKFNELVKKENEEKAFAGAEGEVN